MPERRLALRLQMAFAVPWHVGLCLSGTASRPPRLGGHLSLAVVRIWWLDGEQSAQTQSAEYGATMKLFSSMTSPFARKVRVVIREKGLTAQVEEIIFIPIESHPDLLAVNPLSQIPALIDDAGVHWTDSGLISAWLDQHGTGPNLLPPAGTDEYWRVRRLETAASGLFEMMAKILYEGRRPENERSPFWLKRWQDNLMRSFARADAICPEPFALDMGSLSLAIAGSFCDFRLPHLGWRKIAPRIAVLNEALEKRQSFIETYPK